MGSRRPRKGSRGGPSAVPAALTPVRDWPQPGPNTIRITHMPGVEGHPPVDATFPWFGRELRVNPDLDELVVIDLLEESSKFKVTDPRAMLMTKRYAQAHVHPDDFDEYWRLGRAHRVSEAEILRSCWVMLAAASANPTGGQSDSADGLPGTSPESLPPSPPPGGTQSLREVFLKHIDRIQARTDPETGKVLPINAAVAAQLAVVAEGRGVDLGDPSAARTG